MAPRRRVPPSPVSSDDGERFLVVTSNTDSSSHEPRATRKRLTVSDIERAVAELSERNGSDIHSIQEVLDKQYGCQVSQQTLKRMLMRAVMAGNLKQARTKGFIVVNPSGRANTGRTRVGARRRRQRRRRGGRKRRRVYRRSRFSRRRRRQGRKRYRSRRRRYRRRRRSRKTNRMYYRYY